MRILATLLGVAFLATPAAAEPVDLELVLLADASGSIDGAEIRFERGGWASALRDPKVLEAIGAGYHGRIAVTYVEWGMASSQDAVVPWTVIDGADAARGFGDALAGAPRVAFGMNAIGSALAVATALLEDGTHQGQRRVIDFSGDSARSWGGVPVEAARADALARGITINGLALLCRDADCSGRPTRGEPLEDAFAERIIGGPGSFVVTADGPERFAQAARQKLILEIAGVVPVPSWRRETASFSSALAD